jgi:hypothetical protein
MHVAIDDTYSSNVQIDSGYVTSNRRTNVAVCFPDEQVEHIRREISGCLDEVSALIGVRPDEFHFVEIVNRKGPWQKLNQHQAHGVLAAFVAIYNHYRWPVLIQTVDDRTFTDHGVTLGTTLHGLDPRKKEDQSLFLLMLRLRNELKDQSFVLILDEGRAKPGVKFGEKFFPEWGAKYKGYYDSSKNEPLLQISDFVAYAVNRLTNLSAKSNRTTKEDEQIVILGGLELNSDDMRKAVVPKDFGKSEFDALHYADRKEKGLEP